MHRAFNIGICLLIVSLPLVGLRAQPIQCNDGIRAASPCANGATASGGSCCCPETVACYCQAPAPSTTPNANSAAVPAASPSLGETTALVVAVSHPVTPSCVGHGTEDSHPIQVHPEKLLARLHVLQI